MDLESQGIALHPIASADAVKPESLEKFAGARILLVEDNETNQEVARTILEELNFHVTVADNGEESIRILSEENFDLVFMDMHMPVMDGVTATKEIRKNPEFADLPIIAMTANAMHSDKQLCYEAGMNDYVSKPIDIDQLLNCLRRWLKAKNLVVKPHQMKQISDTVDVSALYRISSLDVDASLRRLMNKRGLYIDILKKFIVEGSEYPEAILEAMDREDMVTAERVAHTLKGILGNIGASALQEQAEFLNSNLKRYSNKEIEVHDNYTTTRLLKDGIDRLIGELREVLREDTEEERKGTVSEYATSQVMKELVQLLKEDDPGAVNHFVENEGLLKKVYPKTFGRISKSIRGFEFEIALELLKEKE